MSSTLDFKGKSPVYIELLCVPIRVGVSGDYTLEAYIHFDISDDGYKMEDTDTVGNMQSRDPNAVSIWIDNWRNKAESIDASLYINDDVFECIPKDTED